MKMSETAKAAAIAKRVERAFSQRPLFRRGKQRGSDLKSYVAFRHGMSARQAAQPVHEYALRHSIEVDRSAPSYLQPINVVYWGMMPGLAILIYSLYTIISGLYWLHEKHGLPLSWFCLLLAALFAALAYWALQTKTRFGLFAALLLRRPPAQEVLTNLP